MNAHQQYATDALRNNTFDFDALGDTLETLKFSSFGVLYKLQEELMGIKRFDFTFKQLIKSNPQEYYIDIPVDFIHTRKKLVYRESKYYHQTLTRAQVIADDNMFIYSFITIINGKDSAFWKIQCLPNGTRFILPIRSNKIKEGLSWRNFETLRDLDSNFTILLVPNKNFSSSYKSFEDLVKFPKYFTTIDLPANKTYFRIELDTMPIPISNILPFKCINGNMIFDDTCGLELYYPNIYSIGTPQSYDMKFIAFCSVDQKTTYKFKNELELFYKYTNVTEELYEKSEIPTVIKNFKPMEFPYSLEDYRDNFYGTKTEIEYKSDKLKSFIKENNSIVIPYLARQIMSNNRHIIKVADIPLNERRRMDNHQEITDESKRLSFDEEMMVFKLSSLMFSSMMILRFFIDGEYYSPECVCKDNKFQYFYISSSKIHDDSVIEVERYDSFELEKDIRFTESEPKKKIDIKSDGCNLYANDLFLTDIDGNFISNGYEIIKNIGNSSIQLQKGEFSNIVNTEILATDSELWEKDLKLWIRRIGFSIIRRFSRDQAVVVVAGQLTSEDPSHFRIFRNGRLLPLDDFQVIFGANIYNNIIVEIFSMANAGDTIITDCTPDKYKQVYFSTEIDPKGYIDLTGHITRPIDSRWYDVYVNGKKIPPTDIEIISPTKFFINNLKSLKNLEIIERNRDEEYFKIGDTSTEEYILQNVEGFFKRIYDAHPDIEDLEDDILGAQADHTEIDIIAFYYSYLCRMFINPDLDQVTHKMRTEFASLFEDGKPFFINPDDAPDSFMVLELNGDNDVEDMSAIMGQEGDE